MKEAMTGITILAADSGWSMVQAGTETAGPCNLNLRKAHEEIQNLNGSSDWMSRAVFGYQVF